MSSSSGRATSVAAGDLQVVSVADRSPAALPPRPPPPSSSSSTALVEYKPPAANPEDEDLEIKLRRIIECVPVRVSNTSGSSAGSGSGDFHQLLRRQMCQLMSIIVLNSPGTSGLDAPLFCSSRLFIQILLIYPFIDELGTAEHLCLNWARPLVGVTYMGLSFFGSSVCCRLSSYSERGARNKRIKRGAISFNFVLYFARRDSCVLGGIRYQYCGGKVSGRIYQASVLRVSANHIPHSESLCFLVKVGDSIITMRESYCKGALVLLFFERGYKLYYLASTGPGYEMMIKERIPNDTRSEELVLIQSIAPLPPIPNLEVTEEIVLMAADETRVWVNYALSIAHDIAIGGNLRLFFQLAVGLWIVSCIGSLFDFLTLIYLGVLLCLSLPILYEKYQIPIDDKLTAAYKIAQEVLHATICEYESGTFADSWHLASEEIDFEISRKFANHGKWIL
ncbi:Reticulon-like protein B10 [Sesamum angolense]|uniref:Reticulon-like protein n=1 Tax=Sesamum angolense TaxID=2727404 RepID=A0AAE2C2X3_9LAMI|nr:Reticulon-like protein B10 [Sesamum angolense]